MAALAVFSPCGEAAGTGPCPARPGLWVSADATTRAAALSNGFVCVGTRGGVIWHASADFEGRGNFGANVLSDRGVTLQSEGPDGSVQTSADASVSVAVVQNDTSGVAVSVDGVTTGPASSALAEERWTLRLAPWQRALSFEARGSIVRPGAARGVRRQWEAQPAAVYGMFEGGVVQMKGAAPGKDFYPSRDGLLRVYGLGGSGPEEGQVGNWSWDMVIEAGAPLNVLLSSSSGRPYWSGVQQVLAGGFANGSAALDSWMAGWAGMPGAGVAAGAAWRHSLRLGVNDADFPTAALPPADAPNMPREDLHATLMGVYASPVGCLCTHRNEVAPGVAVAQISPTIARPTRGYSGTYNYFDPDNYLSTASMLWVNDPYLQAQVRGVVERSGAFLTSRGQLPHHFVGVKPVYTALSGEIQTGPNVFWILSAINYAEAAQDLDWLRSYMPRLRNASSFLFGLIDADEHMASVPGSLMIDVFIRNNFTSDTNAQLVGFFRAFARAERAVGNATGADGLESLADSIAAAMNRRLWASAAAGGDHFITQWDGPALGTTRDFVDYDANLMATAHGVPPDALGRKALARIDRGRCRAGTTFVSEKWYGPGDTTHGNVGDSWTAMGRIAWFDALTRQRYGDAEGLDRLVLGPLQAALLSTTWMHERLSCGGAQQLNRTAMYFEYPSTVAMILRAVRYGIAYDFATVTVAPLGPSAFAYRIGNVAVELSARRFTAEIPGHGLRAFTVGPVAPDTAFRIIAAGDCETQPAKATATSGADGVLRFDAPVGIGCNVTAAA